MANPVSNELRRMDSGTLWPWVWAYEERWPGESGQWDKWIFCLRAARIAADQEST
jgi:hypothetical protein